MMLPADKNNKLHNFCVLGRILLGIIPCHLFVKFSPLLLTYNLASVAMDDLVVILHDISIFSWSSSQISK